MNTKRIALTVTTVIATAGLLAACGSSSADEAAPAEGGAATSAAAEAAEGAESIKIGVSLADQKSLFYIAEADGIKTACDENGVECVVLSADNDAQRQVQQVNDLLAQDIDALIFTAQDATAASAGVKAASDAGVPVIAVDQKPQDDNAALLATYIATDSVKAAEALCIWMFEQMGNEGEIGILQGVKGSTAEVERSQGCQQALDKTPGIKVVATDIANWDETEAYNAATNMLQANPGIKAIFGESDAMGIGAAKAARDQGREIISVGIDGFPTMVTAIKEGLTQATQAQIPFGMGQMAVKDAITIVGGGTVPELQLQDTVLVTTENVNDVNPVDFYGPNVK
jgi:ribose transport system substrate-binding protein